MPDHDITLLILTIIAGGAIFGMIVIDFLMDRKHDRWMAEFEDTPTGRAYREQSDRFWLSVHNAETARQHHLDESEAAAIAHQPIGGRHGPA